VLYVPPIPGANATRTHSDCYHSELAALCERHLVPQTKPTEAALNKFKSTLKKLAKRLNYQHEAMSYERVVNHYSGAQRRVYEAAAATMGTPLSSFDARIKTFAKREKWDFTERCRPPRAIQARSPRFNLELATNHKPLEHRLYRLRQRRATTQIPGKYRVFAKTRNWTQRASDAREMWEAFDDPVCIKIDAHQFDGTLHEKILALTHDFYVHLTGSREHARLLKQTLNNFCRTKNGVKYTVKGTRMSGDLDTAMGNALIMVVVLWCILDQPHLLYDDGDDCLIFTSRRYLAAILKTLQTGFTDYGLNVGVESIAYAFEHIDFCQARPCFLGGVWRFTPNPYKQMRSAFTSVSDFANGSDGPYTRACAISLAGVSDRLPLAWHLATQALLATTRFSPRFDKHQIQFAVSQGKDLNKSLQPREPDLRDRQSFEDTWGIPPEAQVYYESRMNFPVPPPGKHGNYHWETVDHDYLQNHRVYRPSDITDRVEYTIIKQGP
jgi:hypothetical protein